PPRPSLPTSRRRPLLLPATRPVAWAVWTSSSTTMRAVQRPEEESDNRNKSASDNEKPGPQVGPGFSLFWVTDVLSTGTVGERRDDAVRKSLWRTIFGVITGCTLFVTVAPTAGAAPDPCSASGLAATSSGVLNAASGYLDGHPDANTVLTAAVNQPPADAKS